ncbi:helix-turn-helix domain-containing protein [Budviciaceae bacterium CWB-B4]|uniref:Helix-turn-helix domain-containing protein n=1 Tax=Limnobaculum xujianqingii TaxID=2738837 RepID=A0A9D7AH01_9GAMM|nr:helix-turn-helix domain-containing protein [Limnobaculum xujianqingii]MBK5072537.1 helix-turn-helix domain-containing protein [Limnobaculum xujianqingii]MBK5175846.1 helix-turn-helix domain-containing protein [Limnobaculum xujianqingii]
MLAQKQDLTSLFVNGGYDWSSKAIYAALDQRGTDLNSLEQELGLKKGSMRNVFYRQCRSYEQVIADRIGVPPSIIWPSRYADKVI